MRRYTREKTAAKCEADSQRERNAKLEALASEVWERCVDYSIVEKRVVALAVELFGPLPCDKA